MFNGIIKETAKIYEIKLNEKGLIKFITNLNLKNYKIGSSIACDGICLTIIEIQKKKNFYMFCVNASEETVNMTTIKVWKKDQIINLEKSLKLNQEISGHFVYGHIDEYSEVIKIDKIKNSWNFYFKQVSKINQKFIIVKGSIAINGISLTIANIYKDTFSIAVIPHTYKNTNLSKMKIYDKVNIEFDMLAKYIFNK